MASRLPHVTDNGLVALKVLELAPAVHTPLKIACRMQWWMGCWFYHRVTGGGGGCGKKSVDGVLVTAVERRAATAAQQELVLEQDKTAGSAVPL